MLLRRGQAIVDYMVLLGIILLILIPMLYLTTSNLKPYKLNKISEALELVKDGVEQLVLLGKYASSQVIIQLPDGIITTTISNKSITILTDQENATIQTPSQLAGTFPKNGGTHYVKLYNNGSVVFIYQCGNNKTEAFEQCDQLDNTNCNLGINSCYTPGNLYECQCYCRNHFECTTNLCDKINKVCVLCNNNEDCPVGKTCEFGNCVLSNGTGMGGF